MAWSKAPRDWNGLSDRLVAAFGRWHELGLAYDTTPLVPLATFTGRGDRIDVTLNQPAGMGTIRVTEDGSAPTPASPAYTAPLTLASGTTLRAQSFLGEAALGDAVRSEEYTSELQSLMRISYAVFCLKKKKNIK